MNTKMRMRMRMNEVFVSFTIIFILFIDIYISRFLCSSIRSARILFLSVINYLFMPVFVILLLLIPAQCSTLFAISNPIYF